MTNSFVEYAGLKRRTITSQVIEYILELIKRENMKPGDKMPTEKELIQRLGVSRTCVREAVKSLESLRIVAVRPKIGAVLLEPSNRAFFGAESLVGVIRQTDLDALIDFRTLLETGLAALAAERAQESDLLAMHTAIGDYEHALENHHRCGQADLDFHRSIARAAKNPVAIKTIDLILEPIAEQMRRAIETPEAAEHGLSDHVKILKAIEETDPEKSRHAMLAHMKTAERYHRSANAPAIGTPELHVQVAVESSAITRGGGFPF